MSMKRINTSQPNKDDDRKTYGRKSGDEEPSREHPGADLDGPTCRNVTLSDASVDRGRKVRLCLRVVA